MDNSIRKTVEKTGVTVDSVFKSDFQKEGTKSAQLRQVINTTAYYPSKQVSSDLQDNVFSLSEFGFEEQAFTTTENRVAWIDVPEVIESVEDVVAKLPATCTLYKIMSNRPILTSNQSYAVGEGLTTLDNFANSQVVRYGDNHTKAGQLILDNNDKPQYRAVFFSKLAKDDVDNRTSIADDFYATEEINAEMVGTASVVSGQSI